MRCFAVCLALALFSSPSPGASATPPALRLDPSIAPTRYDADLTLDPRQPMFQGRIAIDLQFHQPASRFVLHAAGLTVQRAMLRNAGGGEVRISFKQEKPDRLVFTLPVAVRDRATLSLEYTGPISGTEMSGIFRQQIGADWYAFTQFEAIDARRAFPCFDEPGFKTPWRLRLHIPKELTAAANSPIAKESPEADGRKLVEFAATPSLPAYLVAFVVGPFDVVDAGQAGRNNTPLRLLVPRGRAAEARFAADSMGPLLKLVEDYFGEPFPYVKLDSVVIPKFPGAMENAGLITYQESLLLAKPAEENPARQREFAVTAAHEIAHHWVGDLVTMAWWDDLWLNEGFASWMEDKIVDTWKPEWRQDLVRVSNRNAAMESDSLSSARRIRQPIRTSDDIVNAFDSITYLKGAAVLSMFENYLGPEKFRAGVREYLRAHREQTATAGDFLSALSRAAGQDVAPAFRTFLDQSGVPEVTVAVNCNNAKPVLHLYQSRYRRIGDKDRTDQHWQIPFCYRTEAGSSCTLLRQADTALPLAACPAYVVPDAGSRGYYRYRYQPAKAERTLAEQVGWLQNIGAEVRRGARSAADLFPVFQEFAGAQDRYIITAVVDLANGLRRLVPDNARPAYARFVRDTFGPRARQFGWLAADGETEETRLIRPALLALVADEAEDPELIRQAAGLAQQWLKDRNALPGDTVDLALRVTARHGDDALREQFVKAWRKAADQRERDRILGALGSFSPELLPAILNWTLQPEVPGAEVGTLLARTSRRAETSALAFNFVQANFDALQRKLPRDDESILIALTAGACDAGRAQDVERYFQSRTRDIPGGPRVLAETVETIRQCGALRAAQGGNTALGLTVRGGGTHRLSQGGTATVQP